MSARQPGDRPRFRTAGEASAWRRSMPPGAAVVAAAAGLLVAVLAVLAWDAVDSSGKHRDHARQFERVAGGLGLGATVRPRWCFVNFDPRIEPAPAEISCAGRLLLLPGTLGHRLVLRPPPVNVYRNLLFAAAANVTR